MTGADSSGDMSKTTRRKVLMGGVTAVSLSLSGCYGQTPHSDYINVQAEIGDSDYFETVYTRGAEQSFMTEPFGDGFLLGFRFKDDVEIESFDEIKATLVDRGESVSDLRMSFTTPGISGKIPMYTPGTRRELEAIVLVDGVPKERFPLSIEIEGDLSA